MTQDTAPPRAVRYRDANPRQRRLARLVIPLSILVVLATLLVVIGVAGRAWAEQYVAQRVEESLPPGVTADVRVRLGGVFLLGQYLSGRMEDVRLSSTDLRVQGVPLSARLDLQGAPTDLSRPVERATGSVVLDARAVQALLAAQGLRGDVRIAGGRVRYTDTATILGRRVDYTLTARPQLAGGRLTLEPQSAELRSGSLGVDASTLLGLVAPGGLSVCLASYLPDTLTLDSLTVGEGSARIRFSGKDVLLTQKALARTGACA